MKARRLVVAIRLRAPRLRVSAGMRAGRRALLLMMSGWKVPEHPSALANYSESCE